MFTPLWLGAAVCIPDPQDLRSERLLEWLRQQQISVAHLPPALGQLLCLWAEGVGDGPPQLPALREVFFGGDVLTRRHVAAFRALAPQARITNFYGATETPQAMGYCVLGADDAVGGEEAAGDRRRQIPLGRGIEDVQLLVIHAAGQLCGVGELGEIWVRTAYLARGYLEGEQADQQRFLVNPFTR